MSSPRVVVLDYGFGNVRSAVRALERVGAEVELTADERHAINAAGLVVPGVGAFAACMDGLLAVHGDRDRRPAARRRPARARHLRRHAGHVGRGVEHGLDTQGLGQWPGAVELLAAPVVPHMGWNTVAPDAGSRLFAGIESERFYFVHSYGVQRWELDTESSSSLFAPPVLTWAEHGSRFVAAVENGPLSATQFHPEKSGDAGLQLLQNWLATL